MTYINQNQNILNTKKVSYIGILSALAVIISLLDNLIVIPIAGSKLGLSNIIILLALYKFNGLYAFTILIIRILVVGFLFQGVTGIIYSFSGGLLAFAIMYLAKNTNLFSVIGVSILGSTFHHVGQITCAVILMNNNMIYSYLPMLVLISLVTGYLTGFITIIVLKHLQNIH